jgi:hypothetical protein
MDPATTIRSDADREIPVSGCNEPFRYIGGFDVTSDGRPIKIVLIIDEHTRDCLGGLVERCITAEVLINDSTSTVRSG